MNVLGCLFSLFIIIFLPIFMIGMNIYLRMRRILRGAAQQQQAEQKEEEPKKPDPKEPALFAGEEGEYVEFEEIKD